GDELGLPRVALRAGAVDGGVDDAGADRVDAHADGGEVTGGGHGHADDPALGRGVGDLAGLALDAGHRGGVDDDAALVVRVGGLGRGHLGCGDPHHVERPDQVDVDDLAVGGQVMRGTVAADG